MIEANGRQYHLKFNIERLKLVENALKRPIITIYTEHSGAFSISEMETIFRICLKEDGADTFCSNKQASEIFRAALETENGYMSVNDEIARQLNEDCPFLFPNVSSVLNTSQTEEQTEA